MSDLPCVFGPGDVTICMGQAGGRIYVGCMELHRVKSLSVAPDGVVHLDFERSPTEEEWKATEEEIRACSNFTIIRCRVTNPEPEVIKE